MALFLPAITLTGQETEVKNDTVFNQTDNTGKKQGFWKKYDARGHLIYRGYFKNGRPVGTFKRYYENGKIKSVMYYHPDNDTVDVTFFYQTGKPAARGQYFHRKKTGKWEYYSFYDDFLSYVEQYKNGIKNGPSIKFYATGDTAEVLEFSNGLKDGKWVQYFPGGIPKLRAGYKKDKLEGKFILFYPDGKQQVAGFYTQNVRNGEWKMFNKNGKEERIINFRNGIAENRDELDHEQNALLDSLLKNKGKFMDPEKYGIDIFLKK